MALSVALCTRDGAPWLDEFLCSLAAQSRLPDELVVHDDASTDATVQLIEAFAAGAPFPVRLTRNPFALGSTRNFAAALADSQGGIVALADQDDRWYPDKLERIISEFDLDPTLSMVFSDADLIDEHGTPLGRSLWSTRLVRRTLRRHLVVSEELFARRALTTGCTMAIRRRAVDAALPFPAILDDPRAVMRHDRWLSLVAAAVGTVYAFPEPLVGFRVHPAQETGVLLHCELRGALVRAGVAVLRHPIEQRTQHDGRAGQLNAAAERADEVGDFKEAATLRRVATHHRDRALVGTRGHGPFAVLRSAAHGAYRGDPFYVGAVLADVARAVRPDRNAHLARPDPTDRPTDRPTDGKQ